MSMTQYIQPAILISDVFWTDNGSVDAIVTVNRISADGYVVIKLKPVYDKTPWSVLLNTDDLKDISALIDARERSETQEGEA